MDLPAGALGEDRTPEKTLEKGRSQGEITGISKNTVHPKADDHVVWILDEYFGVRDLCASTLPSH